MSDIYVPKRRNHLKTLQQAIALASALMLMLLSSGSHETQADEDVIEEVVTIPLFELFKPGRSTSNLLRNVVPSFNVNDQPISDAKTLKPLVVVKTSQLLPGWVMFATLTLLRIAQRDGAADNAIAGVINFNLKLLLRVLSKAVEVLLTKVLRLATMALLT